MQYSEINLQLVLILNKRHRQRLKFVSAGIICKALGQILTLNIRLADEVITVMLYVQFDFIIHKAYILFYKTAYNLDFMRNHVNQIAILYVIC